MQIQNEIENALERAYADATKDLPRDEDGREEAHALGEDLRLNVRATGNAGRLSRTGDLSAILAETDLSDTETLQFSNTKGGGPASVELTFKRSLLTAASP